MGAPSPLPLAARRGHILNRFRPRVEPHLSHTVLQLCRLVRGGILNKPGAEFQHWELCAPGRRLPMSPRVPSPPAASESDPCPHPPACRAGPAFYFYLFISTVFASFRSAFTTQRCSCPKPQAWVLKLHPLQTSAFGTGLWRHWEAGGLEASPGLSFQPSRCLWETLVLGSLKTG